MDNSTCHIPETKVQHISYHIIIVCYIINQSIICVFPLISFNLFTHKIAQDIFNQALYCVGSLSTQDSILIISAIYDTIRYQRLTWPEKLSACGQLKIAHVTKQKIYKEKTLKQTKPVPTKSGPSRQGFLCT